MIKIKEVTPEVYFPAEPIVHVGNDEINFLHKTWPQTPRRRVRLCSHQDTQKELHEMFVVYTKETYVRPNVHPKDESLHFIQGSADFIYMDAKGKVVDVVELGDYSTGRRFYCRIPPGLYHTFFIHTPTVTIHETIPGPFRKGIDTVFADWAPEEGDTAGIEKYMAGLRRDVAEFRARRGDAK